MKAYKLVRKKKDGLLYPLFINKKVPFVFNEWLQAECYPTKGFAVRKGFHCCFLPIAPHLKRHLSSGEERVWIEVDVEDWETYDRPESQGGRWILAQMMRVIREIDDNEIERLLKNE